MQEKNLDFVAEVPMRQCVCDFCGGGIGSKASCDALPPTNGDSQGKTGSSPPAPCYQPVGLGTSGEKPVTNNYFFSPITDPKI